MNCIQRYTSGPHKIRWCAAVIILFFIHTVAFAQEKDSSESYAIRKDALDLYYKVIRKKNAVRSDTVRKIPGKLYPAFFITPGYAVQSGLDINFSNVTAIYLSKSANISSVLTYISFTQKNQIIIPLLSNIFTKDNRWNFQGNWYYLKYPVSTFGLGNHTRDDNQLDLDFNTLRVNEFFLKKAGKYLYAGIGYNLSKYWNIKQGEKGSNTYYDLYGYAPGAVSSGLQLCLQYDSRENSLNANSSSYLNTSFLQNTQILGSNSNWSSLMIDARHYIKFPQSTDNVLAFWSYNILSLSGRPPYLDLPANGWDEYSNTCRGYMEGRYRGLSMIDLESEYRIHFMKNDLIGAVVFGHVESYSTLPNRFNFDAVIPGGGVGLRVKINKFSNTNLCIDYGFGLNGSRGLFFNLGEVF
ncbi:MAG: hypothetical protein JST26_09680 [Bacteroidetes bacterium]|nr:hypothetical protein [Bacteroidota bacterium]